ncbi:MAG: hypothetical protein L0Z62_10885 [Gemmataceae bacterium]|nr:hypothetical protein [Gemmataceae bacterium]
MAPHSEDEDQKPDRAGKQWLRLSQLEEGPLRHPPFEDEGVRRLLRRIQEILAEVEPRTVAEWEDGFRRDCHPEREIATWLHIAAVYHYFMKSRPGLPDSSLEEKRAVFQVCLACSLNGPLELQATRDLPTPSEQGAHVIARYYFDTLPLVSDEDRATLQRYFHSG